MKTKSLVIIMIIIASTSLVMKENQSFAAFSNSADFSLEFGPISNDFIGLSSKDFQVKSTLNTSICGNGIGETGEECDGSDFNGSTCATYGFTSGSLQCVSCEIISSDCSNDNGNGEGSGYRPGYTAQGHFYQATTIVDDEEAVVEEIVEEVAEEVAEESIKEKPEEESIPVEITVQEPVDEVVPARVGQPDNILVGMDGGGRGQKKKIQRQKKKFLSSYLISILRLTSIR